ncbi:MAG: NAD(+) synthase, partial [Eggerthellaceae bacterium]|nr:NAD(+) synthase [Eggerthellaceae bacterium]
MNTAEIYSICLEKLKEFMLSCRATDAVLGISGGIDSAVVAVLCKEALGASHVHGVLMAGPYTSDESLSDACELIAHLGIDIIDFPIKEQYRVSMEQYKAAT